MSAPGPVSVSSGGVVAPPSPASAPPSIAAASVPGATSSVGSSPTADLPGMLLRKVAHDIVGPTGVAAGALKELERTFGEEKSAHASMMNLAFRSLQRLKGLPDHLAVCPGHDYGPVPIRRLGEEKDRNPALQAADLAAFKAIP